MQGVHSQGAQATFWWREGAPLLQQVQKVNEQASVVFP
jgi:hypothetical protein